MQIVRNNDFIALANHLQLTVGWNWRLKYTFSGGAQIVGKID